MGNRQDAVSDAEIGILDPYQLSFTVMIRMRHDSFGTFWIAVFGFDLEYRRIPAIIDNKIKF